MRSLLRLSCLALLACVIAAPTIQYSTTYVIEAPVARYLMDTWDSKDAYQTERAFCASYRRERTWWGAEAVRVDSLFRAITWNPTPYGINVNCSFIPKENIVILHTHPATTCEPTKLGTWTCEFGGGDAYQCDGSTGDKLNVRRNKKPFGLVQCDRTRIYAYR